MYKTEPRWNGLQGPFLLEHSVTSLTLVWFLFICIERPTYPPAYLQLLCSYTVLCWPLWKVPPIATSQHHPPTPPTHPPPKQFIIYLGLSFSSRVSTETGTLCLGDERERTCIWKHRASISRDGWQNIPENKRLSLLLVVVFICSQCSEPLQGDTAVGRKSSCLLAYDCRL